MSKNQTFLLKLNSASIFFWETSKIDDSCFGSETDKNRKRIEETANEQIRIQSLDQIKKVRPSIKFNIWTWKLENLCYWLVKRAW